MPINYDALKQFPFEDVTQSYGARECILYALGVGLGSDPTDERQLSFVYEKYLRALPTMGVVLALSKPWLHRPESGITWSKMLHGEQGLEIHQPLQTQGTVSGQTCMEEIVDKGSDKGALLYMSREVHDQATGQSVFTSTQTLFCRADGGFSGSVTEARPVHAIPAREPDLTVDVTTLPQSALIYRLSGDSNPIHVDPQAATAAGFSRPILHGLCSFGIAGHALLRAVADYQPEALRSLKLRFSAPVFPGESIRTEIWDNGSSRFSFRCRIPARNTVIINNGVAELA